MPKFRVWDKVKKDMNEVECISFVDNKIYTTFNHSEKLYIPMQEAVLMQSTGLKDINGVEIYEGDIVTAWSQGAKGTFEIKRRIDGLWLLYPAWQGNQFWYLTPSENGQETCEVIGNIYENKELLGDTDA